MQEKDKIDWNIVGQNNIRRKFVIPVGNLSRDEAEKTLKELIGLYKEDVGFPDDVDYKFPENMSIDKNIWFPIKDVSNDNPDYYTDEDIWKELSRSEKLERLLSKDEQDEIFKKTGFVDWNHFSLDELADYLDKKWRFSSSGDALAIHKMVKFYRENKDKV